MEIPVNAQGLAYHIDATSRDIADKIILVGDPARVPLVAAFFDQDSIEFDHLNREIRTITGKYKGSRITAMSTGMGTDNMEIILNEIHILKEYDLQTAQWRNGEKAEDMALIRVGTCGSPQNISVGALAISRHAIGLDNTCQYYRSHNTVLPKSVLDLQEIANKTPLGEIGVYAAQASPDVTQALVKSAQENAPNRPHITGITASASGFFACQGRAIGRFEKHMRFPNLVDILAQIKLSIDGETEPERVVNIEMENSSLCYLSNLLGYKAGTICAVISTRAEGQRASATLEQSKAALHDALVTALEAIVTL